MSLTANTRFNPLSVIPRTHVRFASTTPNPAIPTAGAQDSFVRQASVTAPLKVPQTGRNKTVLLTKPKHIMTGHGILNDVGQLLKSEGFNRVCIVSGTSGFDGLITPALEASGIKSSIIKYTSPNAPSVIANFQREQSSRGDQGKYGAIIGIGGGMALDNARLIAHELKIPFISIPTSCSTDSASSPIASLIAETGKKTSYETGSPHTVVLDHELIFKSPEKLRYAGVGDLVAKISAAWDWKDTQLHNPGPKDTFDATSLLASLQNLEGVLQHRNPDVNDPEFVEFLTNALFLAGFSMELAGVRQVAGGSEHMVAAEMDTLGNQELHGLTVGISTYVMTAIQDPKAHEKIKRFLSETGFFDYLASNPHQIDKATLIKAIETAPATKVGYHTVLSRPGKIEEAVRFIETDPLLTQVFKE